MRTCRSFHSEDKKTTLLVHAIPLASTKCNVKRERITLPERKVKATYSRSSKSSLTERFLFSNIITVIVILCVATFFAKVGEISTENILTLMTENLFSHPIVIPEIVIASILLTLFPSESLILLPPLIFDITYLLIFGHHILLAPTNYDLVEPF